jgi:hypothetical protein
MSKETDETCDTLPRETMSKSNFTVEIKTIKTKIKSLGNLFLEWSQSVTFHCLPRIFKEKTSFLMRLVWSLIFLVFASFTSYILVSLFINYFQYEVVSTVQVISESPSVFPCITICDSNAFTSEFAQNLTENILLQNLGPPSHSFLYVKFMSHICKLVLIGTCLHNVNNM